MALNGNRSILHKSPGRFLSGTAGTLRSNFNKPGMQANRFESMDDRSAAIPGGHLSPSAWSLPRTAGGMSTVNEINGYATFAGSGAMGVNGDAALTGTGGVSSALLALVVSAVASLSGSGSLTAAVVGKLEAAAALAGSGNLAGAAGALASLLAGLSGSGAMSAIARADGSMSANIRGYSDLTPEGLRDAVWNATATSYDTAGTMGEKLNDAGSAGNPWATVIDSGYTAGEILAILAAVAAGRTQITDLGGGNATVVFRDLGNTLDRVEADVTGSERTSVTFDL